MTTLTATKRSATGRNVRKLKRDTKLIPGVVYGSGLSDNILVQFEQQHYIRVYKSLYTEGEVVEMEIDIEGDKYKVRVQDMDIDPVKTEPRHVDFLIIS